MPAPALTLLLWLLAVGSARAGEVEEAEARRISVELKERVTEARWEAADDLYRRLRLLPGVDLAYDDHWRGFLAAQALGDAVAQADRLAAARAEDATAEVDAAEALLMAWYGRVELRLARKLHPRPPLTMDQVPFEADQRRVLEAAAAALAEEGRYAGLLPLGMYRIGATGFEVVGEEEPVRVHVRR